MFDDLHSSGSTAFLLVFLGVVGFVASLVSLLLSSMRSRIALKVGPATVMVGVLGLTVGVVASARARTAADGIGIDPAAGITETRASELRGDALREARACLLLGLQSGGMPLLAGLIATAIALTHRKSLRET